MTAAVHEPLVGGGELRCSCGRDMCPDLPPLPPRTVEELRPEPPAAFAWTVAIRYAAGRDRALRYAVAEVRAERVTRATAGDVLARHDPTLATDLRLALDRRRRCR